MRRKTDCTKNQVVQENTLLVIRQILDTLSVYSSDIKGKLRMKINENSLAEMKLIQPLVHNITNYVSVQNVANILLASGAAPLMSHAPEELEDINKISSVLVLNIGTLDNQSVDSMLKAQLLARKDTDGTLPKPVILDPVGAGASKFRTETAKAILEGGISVLRGNASEIMALADMNVISKGVESTEKSLSAEQAGVQISKKYGCVVVISGATDIIIESDNKFYIEKQPVTFLTKVTGMGCAVTSLIGAFVAVNPNHFEASCHAMIVFGLASEYAMRKAQVPGTFYTKLCDGLTLLKPSDFQLIRTVNDSKITISPMTGPAYANNMQFFKKPESLRKRRDVAQYLSLCLIADMDFCGNNVDEMLNRVSLATSVPGITGVLLRAKSAKENHAISAALALKRMLKPQNIPLLINDSVAIAKAVDADGVHVGQDDAHYTLAREILGDDKIIGLSVANIEEANQCSHANVDYFSVGPVYPTTSKKDAGPAIGAEQLHAIRAILDRPIVAIGGIGPQNADEVMKTGVDGVSMIASILGAEKPEEVVKKLADIISSQKNMNSIRIKF